MPESSFRPDETDGRSNGHLVRKKEERIGIITTTLHAHAQKLAGIVMYSLGHKRSWIIYSTAH